MAEKTNDPRQESIRKAKPPLQIYRPPGLRTGVTTPTNNNQSPFDATNVTKQVTRKESDQLSNASSESQGSVTKKSDRPKKESINQNRVSTKKTITINKDEIINLVQKLNLSNEASMINDFIDCVESTELATRLSHFLTRYAIEEDKSKSRTCAQLSSVLLNSPSSGEAFYNGLVSSLNQYFECAEKLRTKHLRVWQNYLNFLNDLYSNIGCRFENELAELIFKVFHYLLRPPILQELKIEELECLIAMLLNLGIDLERDCTTELSELKTLVRDALVLANESWLRKMILLILELSASNFQMSQEANEFYFQ